MTRCPKLEVVTARIPINTGEIMNTKQIKNKGHTNVETSGREDLVLLALYRKELYGLQIPQAIEEASEGKRKMQVGTLYPVLHSLEKKGLVESRWGEEGRDERGGARRRYYKLTGLGVAKVDSLLAFQSNLLNWQSV